MIFFSNDAREPCVISFREQSTKEEGKGSPVQTHTLLETEKMMCHRNTNGHDQKKDQPVSQQLEGWTYGGFYHWNSLYLLIATTYKSICSLVCH
jgi:hypothetical protein